jgi:HEAT repeats
MSRKGQAGQRVKPAVSLAGNQRCRSARHSGLVGLLRTFALVGLGLVGAHQMQDSLAMPPSPVIEFRGGLLSVRVRDCPWEAVLKEIERQTGISIRAMGVPAGTLMHEFDAVPLEEGLRRLLRDANLLFIYGNSSGKGPSEAVLEHVWLFPKEGIATAVTQVSHAPRRVVAVEALSGEEGTKAGSELAADGDNSRERRTALLRVIQDHGSEAEQALQQAALDADPSIQTLALGTLAERNLPEVIQTMRLASGNPSTRLAALQALSQHDDTIVLQALTEALADNDIEVKGYAMQVLAGKRTSEATRALGQVLNDPDPVFRQFALGVFGQLDDPVSRSYIDRALNDGEEVRNLAVDLIGRQ